MLMLADHTRADKRGTLHLRLLHCFFEANISGALSTMSWCLKMQSYKRAVGWKEGRNMDFEHTHQCMAFSGREGKGDEDKGPGPTPGLFNLGLGEL